MTNDVKACCQRAAGYLDLGLPEDALAELAEVPVETAAVLHLRVEILFRLKRWQEAAAICVPMVERDPEEPAWWIQAAYALRRAQSLDEAEPLLLEGLRYHPQHVLLLYNLACYACVQGRHEQARDFLDRAIETDPPSVLQMAEIDPDLTGILPWILDRSAALGK